jgi:hypothetical protein
MPRKPDFTFEYAWTYVRTLIQFKDKEGKEEDNYFFLEDIKVIA